MFITLEGPEGGGKSSASQGLASALIESGHQVLLTREPGATSVGRQIRTLLLEGEALSQESELFLFLADRAEHVATLVRPALAQGKVVICDRFADSTVVYQGHARGLDVARLRDLNNFATGGIKPDLTLLFDIDPAVGISRLGRKDRLDNEPLSFHELVREGFLAEARLEPDRWVVIDATEPPERVLEACIGIVLRRMA